MTPPALSCWISDAELAGELKLDPVKFKMFLAEVDRDSCSGFPQKCKLHDGKRWGPAVWDYFQYLYGFKIGKREDVEHLSAGPRRVA